MNAPEIIVLSLFALQLLVNAGEHGKPKPDNLYNLPVCVIRVGIWIALLTWGGFFPWSFS